MRGAVTILSVMIGAAAIGAVYEIERRVDRAEDRLAAIEQAQQDARRDIHVLTAEWSYQVRPARLQRLAVEHLSLAPTSPERILTGAHRLDEVVQRWYGVQAALAEGRTQ